jgi:predicted nucleotidyltransferase
VNRLAASLLDVVTRLDNMNVGCALAGGLAVSVRAEPRFTRDVDLAVATGDDDAAEALVNRLLTDGYGILATVEQEAAERLATVRLLPPGETEEGVVVDLLFASSGIEAEVVRQADRIDVFPSIRIPVASLGHLIALKVLSHDEGRPQDAIDLRALLLVASDTDIADAREALNLVTERGFERGRNLAKALGSAVARWWPSESESQFRP